MTLRRNIDSGIDLGKYVVLHVNKIVRGKVEETMLERTEKLSVAVWQPVQETKRQMEREEEETIFSW